MQKHLIIISVSLIFIGLFTASINCDIVEAVTASIDVTFPSNGTEYYEGDIIFISWMGNDNGEYVKIELFRGGIFYTTITSKTSDDGSYSWTIPSGYASDYWYTIKITDLEQTSDSDSSGYFYIYDKSITVTSPTSGDTWFKGSYNTLQWDSENAGGYMRIELYTGGLYYSTLISSTYNDGLYSWLIPFSISSGSNYQIKITSTTDSSTYDFSPYFTISERKITITTPSGGEKWYAGETKTIKWTSESAGNLVKIQFKLSSTYIWSTIDSSTSNTGSYEWTIPSYASIGAQYQIKITSKSYSDVYDISNYFTIDERYIRINSPDRYDTWYPNETHMISWTSKNAGNTVDIRLVKKDVHIAWISTNNVDSGSYSWKISDVFTPDSSYQVEIRSKQYSSVYDLSDRFSIGKRSIEITSPESEETYYMGGYCNIEWNSEDSGNTIEIELFKDGEFYQTIDSYVTNSGSYSWRIPTDLPESSFYQIRVISSSYDDVFGYSTGNFTIAQTMFQKVTLPILIFVVVIIILVVSTKLIINFRKKKESLPDKNALVKQQYAQASTQINQTEVTQEEYENIWEGGNL